jgi:hypothetical protein
MAKKQMRKTGEFIPRYFGLRLAMPGNFDVFIHPTSYLLGQIMLETPGEIRARVRDWAERHEENYEEVLESLVEEVKKREGTKNMLNYSRRTRTRQESNLVLKSVNHYGRSFTGETKSKGHGRYYTFTIPEPPLRREITISYPGARDSSPDNIWNEVKGKDLTFISTHLTIPELGIFYDNTSGLPQRSNITALAPREREMKTGLPNLPFNLHTLKDPLKMSSRELELYQTLTDLFMEYYLNRTCQYELDKLALADSRVFSEELQKAILDSRDIARFQIIRQKEKKVEKSTTRSDRYHAAVTNMLQNIESFLKKRYKYNFTGYMREFPDSEHETIAKRLEPQKSGPVYSLLTINGLPILVKRFLDHKAKKWHNPMDTGRTPPLKRRYIFRSIDDVTRRESKTQIIFPDKQLEKEGYVVPQILKEKYNSIVRE